MSSEFGSQSLAAHIYFKDLQVIDCPEALFLELISFLSFWDRSVGQHCVLTSCLVLGGLGADKSRKCLKAYHNIFLFSWAQRPHLQIILKFFLSFGVFNIVM